MLGWLVLTVDGPSSTAMQQKRCGHGNVGKRSGTGNSCMMRALSTSRWPVLVGAGDTPPPPPCWSH
eukprot:6790778-Prorocentrum_lima.AAC.1